MKNKANFAQKQNRSSWILLAPAIVLILTFSIYPAFKALMTSFQTGAGVNMQWIGLGNYTRVFKDKIFIQSLINCIVYLIIQVPIMLVLALVLASALNDRNLKFPAASDTCQLSQHPFRCFTPTLRQSSAPSHPAHVFW